MAKAQIGLIGLGVMGENLALNIERHGYPIAVYNPHGIEGRRFRARARTRQASGRLQI